MLRRSPFGSALSSASFIHHWKNRPATTLNRDNQGAIALVKGTKDQTHRYPLSLHLWSCRERRYQPVIYPYKRKYCWHFHQTPCQGEIRTLYGDARTRVCLRGGVEYSTHTPHEVKSFNYCSILFWAFAVIYLLLFARLFLFPKLRLHLFSCPLISTAESLSMVSEQPAVAIFGFRTEASKRRL